MYASSDFCSLPFSLLEIAFFILSANLLVDELLISNNYKTYSRSFYILRRKSCSLSLNIPTSSKKYNILSYVPSEMSLSRCFSDRGAPGLSVRGA